MCAYECSRCTPASVLKPFSGCLAREGMHQSPKYKSFERFFVKKVFLVRGKRCVEDKNHCSSQTHPLLAGHICYSFMLMEENICLFYFENKCWDCETEVLIVAVTSQLQTEIVINFLEEPSLKSLLPLFSFLWLLQNKATQTWFAWLEFSSAFEFLMPFTWILHLWLSFSLRDLRRDEGVSPNWAWTACGQRGQVLVQGEEGAQEDWENGDFMRVSNSDTGKYFTYLLMYLVLSPRFCCLGNVVFGLMISVTELDSLSLLCCRSKILK